MKIKKSVLALGLTACAAISLSMTGCAADYTVTVREVTGDASYTLKAEKGVDLAVDTLAEKYPEEFALDTGLLLDHNLYTDEACRTKFVGGVNGNITLYFGTYSPQKYGKVVFEYKGEEYVVFREAGSTLTAADFTESAYGYGDRTDYVFYSDAERNQSVVISNVEVKSALSGDTTVYVADAE